MGLLSILIYFFGDLLFQALLWLINLLPISHGLPIEFGVALNYFWNALQSFNYVIPIQTILTVFLLTMSFEILIQGWKLSNWLLGHLRGSGSAK